MDEKFLSVPRPLEPDRPVTRRALLRLAGAGLGLAAIGPLLAACGGGAAPSAASTATAGTGSGSSTATTTSSAAGATTTTSSSSSTSAASGNIATNVTLTIPFVTVFDVTFDPAHTINNLTFFNLFDYVYGGLVKYNKDAGVIPDLATNWDISKDGLTYTFHLRDNVKFANGRAVTPDDFVYSWKRSLFPKNLSPVANFMENLAGYDAYTTGKATELSGVKIVDQKTIQLTTNKPVNFFLSYLCTYPWWIVDKDLVQKYGDDNNSAWANHQPYGTGAWKVSSFNPATSIEMVPNENYWGQHSPSITKIDWPILKGPTSNNQALNLYQANQAQIVSSFPLSLLDAVEQNFKNEIVTVVVGGTDSVAMNFGKKPFDNVLVRRAFGMAIDRETYCNTVWRGAYKPTEVFEPPVIQGYNSPAGIAYNPSEAKKVLAAAGFPNGQGLPPITLYFSSDTDSDTVNRWRALAQMWNKTLGSSVEVNTSLTQDQITSKRTSEGGFQMEIMGWINITATPQLMSEVFRTDAIYMKNRFDWGIQVPAMTYNGVTYDPTADAKKFDALMAQADVNQDETTRNQQYAQGEELILRDAVYVPWGNIVRWELVKPNIKGLQWGAFFFVFPRSIEQSVVVTK